MVMNTRFRRNGSKNLSERPIEMGINPKVPRHIPITPPYEYEFWHTVTVEGCEVFYKLYTYHSVLERKEP